jgi:hypothetical protein
MGKSGSRLNFERADLCAFASQTHTIRGVTLTLKDWALYHNLSGDLIRWRLKQGWGANDAFCLPRGAGIERRYRLIGGRK